MTKTFCAGLFLVAAVHSYSQNRLLDEMKAQEEALYSSTKQLNQFFRRFNGEEDERGNRYYPEDRRYRDEKLRRKYIPILFNTPSGISPNLAQDFVKRATDREDPLFLDLHQKEMVAEVSAEFEFEGQKTGLVMFMELQPQGQGYEWVISDVAFDGFLWKFNKDTSSRKPFVHPMSHELEFMNLRKAFEKGAPESYTTDAFQPDYLTLFIYEMNSRRLKFRAVTGMKYHFFGIPGWYFEVSNFNRESSNSGWLISNLMSVSNAEKRELRNYVYGK